MGILCHAAIGRRLPTEILLCAFLPQVNIIPIIAKSDAISKSELTKFKIKITSELVSNGVQIYQFPTDDESVAEINGTMNVSVGRGVQLADFAVYFYYFLLFFCFRKISFIGFRERA